MRGREEEARRREEETGGREEETRGSRSKTKERRGREEEATYARPYFAHVEAISVKERIHQERNGTIQSRGY